MEGEIAVEVGVCDGVVVFARVCGVDGLHASIEADDEEVGIHAQSDAVADGYLLEEGVEAELSPWLVGVAAYGPDVACIDKGGSAEFPEEFGAVFEAEVELDVARLVEEVDALVFAVVLAGSEGADRPSSDAVGAASEVSFLEGELVGVAVGAGDAERGVEGERVVFVYAYALGVVEVGADVLGKGDAAEGVLVLAVAAGADEAGERAEHVA